jgi:hypothetical protein
MTLDESSLGFSFPMVQYLILAMEGRGKMSNQAIYRELKAVCKSEERLPPNWQAEVRPGF